MPFAFDSTFILLIPPMILALYAQYKVRRTYSKFSEVPSAAGLSGAETARRLLRDNGIHDVQVEEVGGTLSDHYDPRDKTVRLSSDNYRGHHLAGLAIAAHEVGHAIQHANGYVPLNLRHAILPVCNLGSMAAFPLFFIGMLMRSAGLMDLGIAFFAAVVVFQVVTLPVEFNASSRAMAQLVDGRYLAPREGTLARKVLTAAALTYVAAAATSLMQLLQFVLQRNASDDR
ncbi:MAG: zinc metallopeptidase [Candidatus Latescibacteria bacterium]|nr:zinc metallopeptidase [Candidatus Latescibacterota bacterium]